MRTVHALVLTLVFLGAGCRRGDEAGPVKVGVAGPITGPQAKNGKDLVDGVTLAVEEWRQRGGVLGRPIEVVARDDEALPKNAGVVADELVDAGVVGVIGHFNSGSTIPASEKYHNAGIVTITPASTNVFVTDREYDDVFRVCGRDDQQGRTAAEFVVNRLKAKKVAIFDNKTSYGKGLADEFEKALAGRVEVAFHESFDEKERNLRPYLAKVKAEEVDVWYFGGIFDQAAPMLLQAGELGITAPMMSGDGVHGYQEDFLEKVGKGAEGTLTTFPNTEAAPGYAEFTKKYRERFQGEPGPYAIYSYTAANILLEGVKAAGSTDGAKIAKALHAGSFTTPVGRIEFDAKGDVKALEYYAVWVVRNGKHVLWSAE